MVPNTSVLPFRLFPALCEATGVHVGRPLVLNDAVTGLHEATGRFLRDAYEIVLDAGVPGEEEVESEYATPVHVDFVAEGAVVSTVGPSQILCRGRGRPRACVRPRGDR